MKLLTQADFDSRTAELADARELAQVDFRRACFAAETGTGTDADIVKAKSHLELIEGKIEGLKSAWEESKRRSALDASRQHLDAYRKMLSDVDESMAERALAMAAIEKAVRALGAAASRYQTATKAVRGAALGYVRTWENHYDVSRVDNPLNGGACSLGCVLGTMIESEGILLMTLVSDRSLLAGRTPGELEARTARAVRSQAELLGSPEEVEA